MPIYGLYYSNLVHLFNGIYVRKLSNLYGIVKNDELEEFKKYIDEFEFDKALAIVKGWNII